MKTILRNIAIYLLILYFVPQIIPGFTIEGGWVTYIIGSVLLAILFLILKPILTIISFPINIITMGIFSTLINALILYLLTILVPDITVQPFTYPRADILGVIIPKIAFNTFFAYVYSAFVIASINAVVKWLIE